MTHSLRILTKEDIDQLCLSVDDVLSAVRQGLIAHADGQALAEPTVSFQPLADRPNLQSVIRGADIAAKLTLTKAVGTYATNPARGLPANPGVAILSDAETGLPRTLIDAAPLTTIRAAAVAAIGAQIAGGPDSEVLGCIGTRGIALQAAIYIAQLFSLSEIRIHSRDPGSCRAAAETLRAASNATVKICADWTSCLQGADIMIDGASLGSHQTLFPGEVLAAGSTLVAYGAFASAAPETALRFDRLVMDRWVDGGSGAFGPAITDGHLTRDALDAVMGDILAKRARGRISPDECILVWQRGLAACDIALMGLMMDRAQQARLGQDVQF
jgi:ornithine cyclodeaminase